MATGRFAPSPSGRLHGQSGLQPAGLAFGRAEGGRVILRIEDLDAERCPRRYADLLEEDLLWLGLDWVEGRFPGRPPGPLLPKRAK